MIGDIAKSNQCMESGELIVKKKRTNQYNDHRDNLVGKAKHTHPPQVIYAMYFVISTSNVISTPSSEHTSKQGLPSKNSIKQEGIPNHHTRV